MHASDTWIFLLNFILKSFNFIECVAHSMSSGNGALSKPCFVVVYRCNFGQTSNVYIFNYYYYYYYYYYQCSDFSAEGNTGVQGLRETVQFHNNFPRHLNRSICGQSSVSNANHSELSPAYGLNAYGVLLMVLMLMESCLWS